MATVFYDFRPIVYRATLAKRSTSRRSESVTPSVCLSVRPTAKLVYGIETAKYITKHFSRSGSPVITVAGCHGNLTVLNLLSAAVTKKISIFTSAGKTMR